MFGCARLTVVFASRTNRRTNSSSEASSSRICFTTSFFSKPPAPRRVARTTRAIPPRASSRSSTYLPNTWGYIRSVAGGPALHRSKCGRALAARGPVAAALGAAVAAAGVGVAMPACDRAPHVTSRTVTMHVPPACAVDGGAYAEYFALGDFDPPSNPATGHFLSETGEALPEIDANARALVVEASESEREWTGEGAVPPAGDVDVLLLPTLASCALSTSLGARVGGVLTAVG